MRLIVMISSMPMITRSWKGTSTDKIYEDLSWKTQVKYPEHGRQKKYDVRNKDSYVRNRDSDAQNMDSDVRNTNKKYK